MIYHLLLVMLLAANTTYDTGSRNFDSKDRCEGFRESLIAQANAQSDMWLISSCEADGEPVTFRAFFRGNPTPGHEEPAPGPKARYRPLPPVYGCTPDAYGDCI